jgi:hypothetical protein
MSILLALKHPHKPVLRGRAYWWEQIRKLGRGAEFTVRDIDMLGYDHTASVRDFIRRLEASGYVEVVGTSTARGASERVHYRVVKTPRALPLISRDGKEGKQGKGQQFMWNFIRMGKPFDWKELADFSSTQDIRVSRESAKRYGKLLLGAGYLLTIQPGRPHHGGIYKLDPRRNSGPNAPMILRSKFLYDPNDSSIPADIEAEAEAS